MVKKGILCVGIGLLMLASAGTVTAYHITGVNSTVAPLTSGDWSMAIPFLIICESEGTAADTQAGSDDRNDRNPTHGEGGLCTTGWNDITDMAAWPGRGATTVGGSAPAATVWSEMSTCDRIVDSGLNGNPPGNGEGGEKCNTNGAGAADVTAIANLQWSAEVGAYGCTVPAGMSLYYRELYAYWSYDGSGSYTPNNLGMDGDNVVIDQDAQPHNTPVGAGETLNMEGAYQGHVAMFINPASAAAAGILRGSSIHRSNAPVDGAAGADHYGTLVGGASKVYEGGCGSAPNREAHTGNVNDEVGDPTMGPVSVDCATGKTCPAE